MPCCAFGIANHSPDDVVSALLKSRIAKAASDIGILPPDAKADTRFKYLLILSTRDFSRNLSRFEASSSKVFVFANPVDLSTYRGMTCLDFVQVDDFTFNRKDLAMSSIIKSTPTSIKRVPFPFLEKLIDQVKYGSLLNPLMTFIYSVSSQNQNFVKLVTFNYLYKGTNVEKLYAQLREVLSERVVDNLMLILSTSVATSYAEALQTISFLRKKKRPVDFENVAKATSTSAYELSYIMSIIDNKQLYTDSFDKAKNRKRIRGAT